MDGVTFWSAIGAIATCVAAVVAILAYRNSQAPKPAAKPVLPSLPPDAIRGKSYTGVDRVLEVRQEARAQVCFHVYPPHNPEGGSKRRVSKELLREALERGE